MTCDIIDNCRTRDFADFLPVVVLAANVDHEIATYFVRDAAIAFCERSKVLRQTIEVELQGCVENPIIEPSCPDLRIVYIHQVCGRVVRTNEPCCRWGPCAVIYEGGSTLTLSPPPSARDELKPLPVTVSLAPTRESCALPEILYERHRETIEAGALAKLHRIHGTPAFDVNLSRIYEDKFTAGITAAGLDRLTGYSLGPFRMRSRTHRIV